MRRRFSYNARLGRDRIAGVSQMGKIGLMLADTHDTAMGQPNAIGSVEEAGPSRFSSDG